MKKILLVTTSILLLAAACSKQAQVQPVQQSPQPQTQTANEAKSRKTYKNLKYSVELNYPEGWVLAEEDSNIILKPTKNTKSHFTISTINAGKNTVLGAGNKSVINNFNLAGKDARVFSCPDYNVCQEQLKVSKALNLLDLPKGWGKNNQINFEVYNDEKVDHKLFEEILYSIKFIEAGADSTSDWKTYTNDKFEFKYPPEYSVSNAEGTTYSTEVLLYLSKKDSAPDYLIMENYAENLNNAFEIFFGKRITDPILGVINSEHTLSGPYIFQSENFRGIAMTGGRFYVGFQINNVTAEKRKLLEQIIYTFKFTK